MRTLSATLEAAQKKAIGEPVAQVVIDDRHCGVFRPRWELVVEETAGDGPVALGLAYDGAILRARSDPAASALYVQRVSNPASAEQWTTWTLLETGVAADALIALAWDGSSIQALFYVASDLRTIKLRQSSDNGQTWSAAATAATLAAGHACRSLAATLNGGGGTLYCLYTDEYAGQTHVCSTTRAEGGGAWSTPQSWGRSAATTINGLAIDAAGDVLHVLLGFDSSLCLFCVAPDSLGTWPDPLCIMRSDSESIAYGWPSVAYNFDQSYCIFFVESNSVQGSRRLNHVMAASWETISMFARPYALEADYGACAVGDLAYHYLCSSRSVYRAKRWGPDDSQRVTVSGDVHSLALREYLDRPGELRLALRNDDGRYATVGVAGAYQAIKMGGQASVRLGYRTGAGDEASYYRPYWLTGIVHQRKDGAQRLLLAATDGWGIIERARARQGYAWTAQTVGSLLGALLASFGFAISDDGAEAWSRPVSRFAVNPGAVMSDVVRSLLRMAGGCLIFRSDAVWEAHWPSAIAHLAVAGTGSVYTYGLDHAIEAAHYGQAEQEVTHVVVVGQGQATGEALDWEAIELGNEDRLRMVVDRRLATSAEAEQRAAGDLAAWQQAAANGFIVASPHVGLEVLDAITINDAAAGLDGAIRLVVANQVILDRAQGVFEQKLGLGR